MVFYSAVFTEQDGFVAGSIEYSNINSAKYRFLPTIMEEDEEFSSGNGPLTCI